MIEPDDIIRFRPCDVPELEEVREPERRKAEPNPEPKDWRPFGCEW